MITEIAVAATYVGKDGTQRYVDDVVEGAGSEEVVYYELTKGDGQAPIGYCSIKRFVKWAVMEVPTALTIEQLMQKLYGSAR